MGDMSYDADEAAGARAALLELRSVMAEYGRGTKAKTGTMLVGIGDGKRVLIKSLMLAQYAANDTAAVGAMIKCACCGKDIKKNSYQQKFCVGFGKKKYACKDTYWNVVDAARADRANAQMALKG